MNARFDPENETMGLYAMEKVTTWFHRKPLEILAFIYFVTM